MKRNRLFKLMNWWPPFLGAGIRLTHISEDLREIDVCMKLSFFNRNYVGVQFGGSLYAMTDPFLMLMLMENLGRDYIVWDKAASIQFLKPGRGRVHCQFRLHPSEVANIKQAADTNHKTEPEFHLEILDENEVVIAKVHKTLYVRRKEDRSI